jgi:hypothetical protein
MTDPHRPTYSDAPDYPGSDMDPPYNRRIRHGKMSAWAEAAIWTVALLIIAGFCGGLAAFISGVVE